VEDRGIGFIERLVDFAASIANLLKAALALDAGVREAPELTLQLTDFNPSAAAASSASQVRCSRESCALTVSRRKIAPTKHASALKRSVS
jgi:hypothetical protein